MGVDIHVYAEAYDNYYNRWVPLVTEIFDEPWHQMMSRGHPPHVAIMGRVRLHPCIRRSYDLFNQLCSVRLDKGEKRGGKAKGLPPDLSGTTRDQVDQWRRTSLESPSWLTLEEMLREEMLRTEWTGDAQDWIRAVLLLKEYADEGCHNNVKSDYTQYRFVFWFAG